MFLRIAPFIKIGFDGGRDTGLSADVGEFLLNNGSDLPPVNIYRIDGNLITYN